MATISNLIVNMIARTAGFEAGMNKSKKQLSEFQQALKNVNSVMHFANVGFALRGVQALADGITEYHRALREGEDGMVAFVEALPLLGNVEKSFAAMATELSGIKQLLEGSEKAMKVFADRGKYLQSMYRDLQVLNATEDDAKRLKALYGYQDMLEKITATEKAMREAVKLNPDIVMPNFGADRFTALKIYQKQLSNINEELEKMRKLESMREANNIWEVRKGIMNQITDMQNRMSGMSDDMVSMLARMRDIGAPFKEVQDMIKDVRKLEEVRSKFEDMKKNDGLLNKTSLPDKEILNKYQFQEINPAAINVAALYPSQNPITGRLDTLINLERSRQNGELA